MAAVFSLIIDHHDLIFSLDLFADRGRRGGLSLSTASPSLPAPVEEEEAAETKVEDKVEVKEEKSTEDEQKGTTRKESSAENRPSKERVSEICGMFCRLGYRVLNVYSADF